MPFVKGKTGNPGGRPKIPEDVREMARALTPEAIQTMAEVMRDTSQPGSARVMAADKIVDRGYGKAPQHITTERLESLSNVELADELAAAIDALRNLGVDPAHFLDQSAGAEPSRRGKGKGLTH